MGLQLIGAADDLLIQRMGDTVLDGDKPITEKPAETRMGSGKGSPEYWVAVVKPGRVMFEIAGVSEEVAREALRLASHKLPIKTKIVKREDLEAQEVGE